MIILVYTATKPSKRLPRGTGGWNLENSSKEKTYTIIDIPVSKNQSTKLYYEIGVTSL